MAQLKQRIEKLEQALIPSGRIFAAHVPAGSVEAEEHARSRLESERGMRDTDMFVALAWYGPDEPPRRYYEHAR